MLDPQIARHLMRRQSADNPRNSLTEREREILMLAEGLSNAAIRDA